MLSLIADIVGILGAVFALMAWLQSLQTRKAINAEERRQRKRVKIIINHGGQSIPLPAEIRRAELTRSEILGLLGMLPMKKKGRYSLSYLNSPDFMVRVNQIADTTGDATLTIPCTQEELDQFDVIPQDTRVL